jgi:lipopolysaccharide export system permease protein
MRSLSVYVLRQVLGPTLLFALLLTIVVWMTQALRLLDLVINRGQSAGIFAYLTVLMLPTVLVVIVPIAFFAASLYALNKLNSESELVVMWSAGVSRFQLAVPLLLAAGAAMAVTYLCGLYLMPLGQRTMKDKVFDIRADIGAAILREGAFTTPTGGLTVFIRELSPDGQIRGIMVHDNHDQKLPITYLAEAGTLVQSQEGARLIMFNGTIERREQLPARLSVLKFERYVFDLDQYAGPQRADRDTSERYLSELLDPKSTGTNTVARRIYFAEAHNRLSSPLYCIAFALIALAATAKGRMARSSYALRLTGAGLFGGVLRLLGYGAQGLAAHSPSLAVLLYVIPLLGATMAACVLADVPLLPRFARRQVIEAGASS